MTNFSQFLSGGSPEDAEPGIEIEGSFNCQSCNQSVDVAQYDMVNQILKWKCLDGHSSFIKDFAL